MAYTDITTAVAAVIGTASGTANIYQYRRYNSGDDEQMKTLFEDSNVINTWQITRTGAESSFDDCTVDRINEFTINGYYSIDDTNASETTFQEIVNQVMQKFDLETNMTLSGNVSHFAQPAQLPVFESVMYGGIGCWMCEIKIYPVEQIATS